MKKDFYMHKSLLKRTTFLQVSVLQDEDTFYALGTKTAVDALKHVQNVTYIMYIIEDKRQCNRQAKSQCCQICEQHRM